jgi:hypothetical protein
MHLLKTNDLYGNHKIVTNVPLTIFKVLLGCLKSAKVGTDLSNT